MAARLRAELKPDVMMVHGHYGEFKVLVDDEVVVDGGMKVILGIMPPAGIVLEAVRARLAGTDAGRARQGSEAERRSR